MTRKSYQASLDTALAYLRAAQSQVNQEIGAYPGPISGCDTQFNQLLSDRMRVVQAVGALQNEPFVPTPRSPVPSAALESR